MDEVQGALALPFPKLSPPLLLAAASTLQYLNMRYIRRGAHNNKKAVARVCGQA